MDKGSLVADEEITQIIKEIVSDNLSSL